LSFELRDLAEPVACGTRDHLWLHRALEPLVPVFNSSSARILWASGQTDAAIAAANSIPSDNAYRASTTAIIYASLGRYSEAADALMARRVGADRSSEAAAEVARLLRAAPAKSPSPQVLPGLGGLGFVYLYAGAPERVLEWVERNVEAGYNPPYTLLLWHTSHAPARKPERFKKLARAAGLVDYWRARGWPDLCRPLGADDFVCD